MARCSWLSALLLLLQYRLWLSADGVREVLRLQSAVARSRQNAQLPERNRQLAAEVRDLKQGYAALEERARTDLGMIAGNETFYQVVPPRRHRARGCLERCQRARCRAARPARCGARQ